jgi:hypothetical protein
VYDFLTAYGPLAVCLALGLLSAYELAANRRWRKNRDFAHAAFLAAVADRADQLALEGQARPGTRAVYWVDRDFDFTLGGWREDDRKYEDYQPEEAPQEADKA